MEDLTLDKLKTLEPIWKRGKLKAKKYPKKKKDKKYLVYREDRTKEMNQYSKAYEKSKDKKCNSLEEQKPNKIKPSNKSDKANNKQAQFSFEKFKSDIDKNDNQFDSKMDVLTSIRESAGKKKEVPIFMNMYDPFRANLEIIQKYLKNQTRKQKQPEKEELETIQEKKSSFNSSKSKGLIRIQFPEIKYQYQHIQQYCCES
jgi:hypothetical protein